MDETKLNPFAYSMAKDLMKCRSGLPLATAMAAVNYKLANIASQLHVKVDTMSGYAPTPVNVYSLILLNSGGGKNSSLGLMDRIFFGDAFDLIRSKVYPFYKQKAIDWLEEIGIDREGKAGKLPRIVREDFDDPARKPIIVNHSPPPSEQAKTYQSIHTDHEDTWQKQEDNLQGTYVPPHKIYSQKLPLANNYQIPQKSSKKVYILIVIGAFLAMITLAFAENPARPLH